MNVWITLHHTWCRERAGGWQAGLQAPQTRERKVSFANLLSSCFSLWLVDVNQQEYLFGWWCCRIL